MHAKSVLLVHNYQAELLEGDALLHQRMRADNQRRPRGNGLERGLAGLAGDLGAEPDRIDAERRQPSPETAEVLLGQQLGRRHDGHLVTVADGPERGQCRDHRLAGADVALDQPLHGVGSRQVAADFSANTLLGRRQLERKPPQEFRLYRASPVRQLWRAEPAPALVQADHAQVVRQQLFQRQALLGRVTALHQRRHVCIRWRAVNESQGVGQGNRGESGLPAPGGGQQILWQQFSQIEFAPAEAFQRLIGKRVPPCLGEALG